MGTNRRSKLTFEDAEEIRASTETRTELAKQYGVTSTAINDIVNNKTHRPEGVPRPGPLAIGRPRKHWAQPCECGCGELAKPYNRFIQHHDRRVIKRPLAGAVVPRTDQEWIDSMISMCEVEDYGMDDFCMTWKGSAGVNGYASTKYKGKETTRHRLMVMLLHPGIDLEGCDVHHRCHNRLCLQASHLSVTSKAAHARIHHSKLSSADVKTIRSLALSGLSNSAIAERYGMHRNSIGHIVAGRRWKDNNAA